MNKINKKFLALAAFASTSLSALAEGETGGFDIATVGADVVTQLGAAKVVIGTVLGAALLITVAIVIYRKFSGGIRGA